MSGTILIYLMMVNRAVAAATWKARKRPIAGGLGDTGLPDPPGT